MSVGWIKLHRQLLDWEWYDDINTSRLFIHLMITANHKKNNWRGIEIKRGSRLTSLDKLSKETNLSVSKIRTSIKKLISTNEIASKSHSQHTVFTMINYDAYQCDDKQNDKPIANKSQASSKQIATNKNDKNNKNEINKDKDIETCEQVTPVNQEIEIGKSVKKEKDRVPENQRQLNQEDVNFAEWFYSKLLELNPKQKHPSKSAFEKWTDTVRLIRVRDNKTYEEMSNLFLWVNKNDFWKGNILSPVKLRKHWDMITIQMERDNNNNKTGTPNIETPGWENDVNWEF